MSLDPGPVAPYYSKYPSKGRKRKRLPYAHEIDPRRTLPSQQLTADELDTYDRRVNYDKIPKKKVIAEINARYKAIAVRPLITPTPFNDPSPGAVYQDRIARPLTKKELRDKNDLLSEQFKSKSTGLSLTPPRKKKTPWSNTPPAPEKYLPNMLARFGYNVTQTDDRIRFLAERANKRALAQDPTLDLQTDLSNKKLSRAGDPLGQRTNRGAPQGIAPGYTSGIADFQDMMGIVREGPLKGVADKETLQAAAWLDLQIRDEKGRSFIEEGMIAGSTVLDDPIYTHGARQLNFAYDPLYSPTSFAANVIKNNKKRAEEWKINMTSAVEGEKQKAIMQKYGPSLSPQVVVALVKDGFTADSPALMELAQSGGYNEKYPLLKGQIKTEEQLQRTEQLAKFQNGTLDSGDEANFNTVMDPTRELKEYYKATQEYQEQQAKKAEEDNGPGLFSDPLEWGLNRVATLADPEEFLKQQANSFMEMANSAWQLIPNTYRFMGSLGGDPLEQISKESRLPAMKQLLESNTLGKHQEARLKAKIAEYEVDLGPQGSVIERFFNIVGGTNSWQMEIEGLSPGKSGLGVDPNSPVAKQVGFLARQNGSMIVYDVNGSPAKTPDGEILTTAHTPGRDLAAEFTVPGSIEFNIISGTIDAIVMVKLDPATWALKGAKLLQAYKTTLAAEKIGAEASHITSGYRAYAAAEAAFADTKNTIWTVTADGVVAKGTVFADAEKGWASVSDGAGYVETAAPLWEGIPTAAASSSSEAVTFSEKLSDVLKIATSKSTGRRGLYTLAEWMQSDKGLAHLKTVSQLAIKQAWTKVNRMFKGDSETIKILGNASDPDVLAGRVAMTEGYNSPFAQQSLIDLENAKNFNAAEATGNYSSFAPKEPLTKVPVTERPSSAPFYESVRKENEAAYALENPYEQFGLKVREDGQPWTVEDIAAAKEKMSIGQRKGFDRRWAQDAGSQTDDAAGLNTVNAQQAERNAQRALREEEFVLNQLSQRFRDLHNVGEFDKIPKTLKQLQLRPMRRALFIGGGIVVADILGSSLLSDAGLEENTAGNVAAWIGVGLGIGAGVKFRDARFFDMMPSVSIPMRAAERNDTAENLRRLYVRNNMPIESIDRMLYQVATDPNPYLYQSLQYAITEITGKVIHNDKRLLALIKKYLPDYDGDYEKLLDWRNEGLVDGVDDIARYKAGLLWQELVLKGTKEERELLLEIRKLYSEILKDFSTKTAMPSYSSVDDNLRAPFADPLEDTAATVGGNKFKQGPMHTAHLYSKNFHLPPDLVRRMSHAAGVFAPMQASRYKSMAIVAGTAVIGSMYLGSEEGEFFESFGVKQAVVGVAGGIVGFNPAATARYADWFNSQVFKPLALLTRIAYPVRVIGEEQFRMKGAGLTSLFQGDPNSYIAYLISGHHDATLRPFSSPSNLGRNGKNPFMEASAAESGLLNLAMTDDAKGTAGIKTLLNTSVQREWAFNAEKLEPNTWEAFGETISRLGKDQVIKDVAKEAYWQLSKGVAAKNIDVSDLGFDFATSPTYREWRRQMNDTVQNNMLLNDTEMLLKLPKYYLDNYVMSPNVTAGNIDIISLLGFDGIKDKVTGEWLPHYIMVDGQPVINPAVTSILENHRVRNNWSVVADVTGTAADAAGVVTEDIDLPDPTVENPLPQTEALFDTAVYRERSADEIQVVLEGSPRALMEDSYDADVRASIKDGGRLRGDFAGQLDSTEMHIEIKNPKFWDDDPLDPLTRKRGDSLLETKPAPFRIVNQGQGDFDGMRADSGKATILNTKPGNPGWLGNPVRAEDVDGGTLTRKQATEEFEAIFLNKIENDPEFRQAVLELRGKSVGYYKPNEEDIHLHVVQKWLEEQDLPPAPVRNFSGGHSNAGKGTAAGDGKDAAMRQVADSSIVELADSAPSSSLTTRETLGEVNSSSKVVMLARNGKLRGKPLTSATVAAITNAHSRGATFVVGDMPNVDSQFIDLLDSINAKYTIYHSGGAPRIKISQPDLPPPLFEPKPTAATNNLEKPGINSEDALWQILLDATGGGTGSKFRTIYGKSKKQITSSIGYTPKSATKAEKARIRTTKSQQVLSLVDANGVPLPEIVDNAKEIGRRLDVEIKTMTTKIEKLELEKERMFDNNFKVEEPTATNFEEHPPTANEEAFVYPADMAEVPNEEGFVEDTFLEDAAVGMRVEDDAAQIRAKEYAADRETAFNSLAGKARGTGKGPSEQEIQYAIDQIVAARRRATQESAKQQGEFSAKINYDPLGTFGGTFKRKLKDSHIRKQIQNKERQIAKIKSVQRRWINIRKQMGFLENRPEYVVHVFGDSTNAGLRRDQINGFLATLLPRARAGDEIVIITGNTIFDQTVGFYAKKYGYTVVQTELPPAGSRLTEYEKYNQAIRDANPDLAVAFPTKRSGVVDRIVEKYEGHNKFHNTAPDDYVRPRPRSRSEMYETEGPNKFVSDVRIAEYDEELMEGRITAEEHAEKMEKLLDPSVDISEETMNGLKRGKLTFQAQVNTNLKGLEAAQNKIYIKGSGSSLEGDVVPAYREASYTGLTSNQTSARAEQIKAQINPDRTVAVAVVPPTNGFAEDGVVNFASGIGRPRDNSNPRFTTPLPKSVLRNSGTSGPAGKSINEMHLDGDRTGFVGFNPDPTDATGYTFLVTAENRQPKAFMVVKQTRIEQSIATDPFAQETFERVEGLSYPALQEALAKKELPKSLQEHYENVFAGQQINGPYGKRSNFGLEVPEVPWLYEVQEVSIDNKRIEQLIGNDYSDQVSPFKNRRLQEAWVSDHYDGFFGRSSMPGGITPGGKDVEIILTRADGEEVVIANGYVSWVATDSGPFLQVSPDQMNIDTVFSKGSVQEPSINELETSRFNTEGFQYGKGKQTLPPLSDNDAVSDALRRKESKDRFFESKYGSVRKTIDTPPTSTTAADRWRAEIEMDATAKTISKSEQERIDKYWANVRNQVVREKQADYIKLPMKNSGEQPLNIIYQQNMSMQPPMGEPLRPNHNPNFRSTENFESGFARSGESETFYAGYFYIPLEDVTLSITEKQRNTLDDLANAVSDSLPPMNIEQRVNLEGANHISFQNWSNQGDLLSRNLNGDTPGALVIPVIQDSTNMGSGILGDLDLNPFGREWRKDFRNDLKKSMQSGDLKNKKMFVWTNKNDEFGPKYALVFPAKPVVKTREELETLLEPLLALKKYATEHGIAKIVFPPLTDAWGEVNYEFVESAIVDIFKDTPEIEISIQRGLGRELALEGLAKPGIMVKPDNLGAYDANVSLENGGRFVSSIEEETTIAAQREIDFSWMESQQGDSAAAERTNDALSQEKLDRFFSGMESFVGKHEGVLEAGGSTEFKKLIRAWQESYSQKPADELIDEVIDGLLKRPRQPINVPENIASQTFESQIPPAFRQFMTESNISVPALQDYLETSIGSMVVPNLQELSDEVPDIPALMKLVKRKVYGNTGSKLQHREWIIKNADPEKIRSAIRDNAVANLLEKALGDKRQFEQYAPTNLGQWLKTSGWLSDDTILAEIGPEAIDRMIAKIINEIKINAGPEASALKAADFNTKQKHGFLVWADTELKSINQEYLALSRSNLLDPARWESSAIEEALFRNEFSRDLASVGSEEAIKNLDSVLVDVPDEFVEEVNQLRNQWLSLREKITPSMPWEVLQSKIKAIDSRINRTLSKNMDSDMAQRPSDLADEIRARFNYIESELISADGSSPLSVSAQARLKDRMADVQTRINRALKSKKPTDIKSANNELKKAWTAARKELPKQAYVAQTNTLAEEVKIALGDYPQTDLALAELRARMRPEYSDAADAGSQKIRQMDNEQASLPFGSSEETAETPLSSFPKSFMSGTVVPPEKRNKYTRMKDDLFKILAGKPTDFFSRHPVFKQFFFEEVVRLAADASPEVATQLRKNVETSFQLKGINYSLPAKLAVFAGLTGLVSTASYAAVDDENLSESIIIGLSSALVSGVFTHWLGKRVTIQYKTVIPIEGQAEMLADDGKKLYDGWYLGDGKSFARLDNWANARTIYGHSRPNGSKGWTFWGKQIKKPVPDGSGFWEGHSNVAEWNLIYISTKTKPIKPSKNIFFRKSPPNKYSQYNVLDSIEKGNLLDGRVGSGPLLSKERIAESELHTERWGAGMSVEDIDEAAKIVALEKTLDLLYNLSEKTAIMDSLRIVLPFGEAWKELFVSWGKIIGDNPVVLRKGQMALQGAEDSGFISRNDKGERIFTYPGSKEFFDFFGSPGFQSIAKAAGLSMANSITPGVGLPVSFTLDLVTGEDRKHDPLVDVFFPIGRSSDKNLLQTAITALSPQAAESFYSMLADVDSDQKKANAWIRTLQIVLSELTAGDQKVLTNINSDFKSIKLNSLSIEEVQNLIEEVDMRTDAFLLGQALIKNPAPSAPLAEQTIQTWDGPVKLLELQRILKKEQQNGNGSYMSTPEKFNAKYGPIVTEILRGVASADGKLPAPTDKGYTWMRSKNGKTFAQKAPNASGYLQPIVAKDFSATINQDAYGYLGKHFKITRTSTSDYLARASAGVAKTYYESAENVLAQEMGAGPRWREKYNSFRDFAETKGRYDKGEQVLWNWTSHDGAKGVLAKLEKYLNKNFPDWETDKGTTNKTSWATQLAQLNTIASSKKNFPPGYYNKVPKPGQIRKQYKEIKEKFGKEAADNAYLFEIMRWYKAQTNQLDRLYGQERPDTLDKAPSPYWRGSSKVRWHLERTSLRANLNGLRLAYERTTNGDLRLDEIIKSLYSGDATTREIFNMKDETG